MPPGCWQLNRVLIQMIGAKVLAFGAVPTYFTAIITPGWDVTPPMVSTTACGPDATEAGTTAFTCSTPATSPGAEPAYSTVAATPPMLTET
jgi:hypothetical protein